MKISIAKKLEEKKMTRYELAKRIGVTYPTIDKIYREESTSIKFEILESICRELECTLDEVIIVEDPTIKRLMAYRQNFKELSKGDTD